MTLLFLDADDAACAPLAAGLARHVGESLGLELAIPRTSRTVNDTMPGYTFGLLTKLLAAQGKTVESSKIAVLGIAFKNNTGD